MSNVKIDLEKEGFFKLDYETIVKQLEKNFNLELINMSLRELFSSDITKKYIYFGPEHNRELLKKILEDKDKKFGRFNEVLDLTFFECLNIFRYMESEELKNKLENLGVVYVEKRVDSFVDKIINDEIKNGEDPKQIIKYINLILKQLYQFEKFFLDKKDRRSAKN